MKRLSSNSILMYHELINEVLIYRLHKGEMSKADIVRIAKNAKRLYYSIMEIKRRD